MPQSWKSKLTTSVVGTVTNIIKSVNDYLCTTVCYKIRIGLDLAFRGF